ncbi:MAG: hypothetical protein RLZZ184_3777 [Cyanobacteriota bacterium]
MNQKKNPRKPVFLEEIKNRDHFEREIDYIVEAVVEWKSTGYNNLYQVLKECQQSDLLLTENMVNLPKQIYNLGADHLLCGVPMKQE